MTTFQVSGFNRETHSECVILIDADDHNKTYAVAKNIVGPGFCFDMAMNLGDIHVPDDAKNVLSYSNEELYARVPELNPNWRRPRNAAAA
jgi:hypothetical protein